MVKIAVIGGGIGGLATSILLAQKGHDVTIFEKNKEVGGRSFRFRGFEAGPTLVLMPSVFDKFLGKIGSSFSEIKAKRLSPSYTIYFADGSDFSFDSFDKMRAEILEKYGTQDARGFEKFMSDYKKVYASAMKNFIAKSFTSLKQALPLLPHFLAFRPFSSVGSEVKRYFKNENLRKAFTLQTVYVGLNAEKTPSPYGIIPFIEVQEGVWEFKSGFGGFVDFLEKKARENSVKIRKNAPVEKIIIENKKAKGVIVKGKKLFFDAVVCNADLAYANENLFDGKNFSGKEHSCSAFLLFLKPFSNVKLPKHSFFVSSDLDKNIHELFKEKKVPSEPSFYCHLQEKGIVVLAPVPDALEVNWRKESINFTEKLMELLKKRTGITGNVVGVISPADFKKQLNVYNGGAFGLSPTLLQTAFFRPPVKSKEVEKLFFVGASAQPGGGVPIVLISAELCAGEVEKEFKGN